MRRTSIPVLFLFALSYNSLLLSQTNTIKEPPLIPLIKYLIDLNSDGQFDSILPDIEPMPPQGKDAFYKSFIVKYPPLAIENNITGLVILDVSINELGQVTQVGIKKSLYKYCDEEAKKAFIIASSAGYAPLLINNKPVKYKMEFPILFWL